MTPTTNKKQSKGRKTASAKKVATSKLKIAKGKTNQKASAHRDYIPAEARIIKLTKTNPRREGTFGFESFKLIKNGMTVEQFVEKGGRRKDLRWDLDREHVKLDTKKAS